MSTSAHAPATDTQLDPSARVTILRSDFLPNGHWLYHFLSDAHLSADSLALSHLSRRQLRVEVPTRTNTHTHILWDSHTLVWSVDKVIDSGRRQLLSVTRKDVHTLLTFGCLAYFPVLVSLMVLMSRISTS